MSTKFTDKEFHDGAMNFSSKEEANRFLRQGLPLTESTALRNRDFPTVRGTDAVRRLLVQQNPSHVACWIEGETVYGDVRLVNQNWGTYTRPVFAYLEHVPPVRSFGAGISTTETWSATKGFTRGFSLSITRSFEVSAGINIVNVSSGLSIGFEAHVTWDWSKTHEISRTLEGPNDFYQYQVAIVYAHCSTSAGALGSQVTELRRTLQHGNRVDLAYLGSVATVDELNTNHDLHPLTWRDVQLYLLSERWGTWVWDWTAFHDPRRRY
jgi:hypothetical protein